jgi:hypothetical protein
MKHFREISLIGVLLVGVTTAVAQSTTPATTPNDHDINRTELNNLDRYLDKNPQVASDLKGNPSLINDPTYLQNHPDLQNFLSKHPGVAEEAKENPNQLVKRETRFDNQGRDISQKQAASFDRYLDSHPDVAKDLRQNPALANDPTYLQNHPGLSDYEKNHPGVTKELQENPNAVMKREKRYEHSAADKRQDRRWRRALNPPPKP